MFAEETTSGRFVSALDGGYSWMVYQNQLFHMWNVWLSGKYYLQKFTKYVMLIKIIFPLRIVLCEYIGYFLVYALSCYCKFTRFKQEMEFLED